MTPAQRDLEIITGLTFRSFKLYAKDINGVAVPLTDYIPFAEVRKKPGSAVVLDLGFAITDAPNGEITCPGFTDEETFDMPAGTYQWDFILQRPSGERDGVYIAGEFVIRKNITHPPE